MASRPAGAKTPMLRLLRGLSELAYRVSRVLIALGLAGIVLMVAWQVFTRYVLNASAVWTTEVATLLLIWMLYLGAAMAIRDGEMVAITVVLERLPPAARRIASLLASLVLGAFLVTMIVLNREILDLASTTPMPVLRISKLWVHLALTVGFALTLLYVVIQAIDTVAALLGRGGEDGR